MDPKEQLSQVTDLLSALVDGTDAGQLGDETPCSDFHVRDLIGHFTLGRFLFAAGLRGDKSRGNELLGGMPEQLGDVLGDDHRATYRDASDETSISRIYGGIHPTADDIPGRLMGAQIGKNAFLKASRHFGPWPQTAVFVTFAAHIAEGGGMTAAISTSISVSNPLAWDPMSSFLALDGGVTEGTVEVFLWDQAGGAMISYESDDTVGVGLNTDGTLSSGGTWTFLLGDVLDAAGFVGDFVGFGWIVANFDGVAGTHTTSIFNVGFNQAFHAVPAIGQGFHEMAGLPVVVP